MAPTPIFIADAFVGHLPWRKLRGNPAAVVLLTSPRDAQWMQEVAAEMNLSETTFLTQTDAQNFDLRWFTPETEVKLCGHATLASAHVWWEIGQVPREQAIRFHTQSGVLTAHKEGEWIALDFSAQKYQACDLSPELLSALGLDPRDPIFGFRAGQDWLLEAHESVVEGARPDFAALREICSHWKIRGVILTARAEWGPSFGYDFVSRFFAPAIGIPEDPATGSAHAALAPFWGERLEKREMTGFQASPRGGIVRVKWQGERVEIAGQALTALRGELFL